MPKYLMRIKTLLVEHVVLKTLHQSVSRYHKVSGMNTKKNYR